MTEKATNKRDKPRKKYAEWHEGHNPYWKEDFDFDTENMINPLKVRRAINDIGKLENTVGETPKEDSGSNYRTRASENKGFMQRILTRANLAKAGLVIGLAMVAYGYYDGVMVSDRMIREDPNYPAYVQKYGEFNGVNKIKEEKGILSKALMGGFISSLGIIGGFLSASYLMKRKEENDEDSKDDCGGF